MPDELLASVVIPVWRDEVALERALASLPPNPRNATGPTHEVIVSCVLGDAERYERLRCAHPAVRWVAAPRGRAVQMNAGAAAASGRWLLFLHADSRLPADWLDALAVFDTSATAIAGAFAFALDSPDWRARVIEAGVRLRVALLGLPYGDQALFVRRDVFEAIGGYRDLPLMEDVDLVRRLNRIGVLARCKSPVVTSPRRWERDGWFRRTVQNARVAARFLLGASPARLAQQYFARARAAIVMTARAPWTAGKTRLAPAAVGAEHEELRRALFLDTLDVVTTVAAVEHIVAFEPVDACERMRELAGAAIDVLAQRGGGLGERLTYVFEDTFRLGIESVVVIGSDLPDLPPELLRRAVALLSDGQDRIVLGPASDGGYYLVGMNRPHPELFRGIEWSTGRVLAQTLAMAKAHDLQVAVLDEWHDVDEPADLERLLNTAADSAACRTRAWLNQPASRSDRIPLADAIGTPVAPDLRGPHTPKAHR